MGFKDSVLTLIGDFVESKRNPEFRSKSDISTANDKTNTDYPLGFQPRVRRHSLNITVGTKSPDEQTIRQRSFSVRTPAIRRNTIMPGASGSIKNSTVVNSAVQFGPKMDHAARRFSEPFSAQIQDLQPAPVRRVANRNLLSEKSQQSSEESDSDTSEHLTPAASPRVFQNSYEKRNNRFFSTSASWRSSLFLEEQPIKEEDTENEDQPEIIQESAHKGTIITITASPCH